MSTLLSNALVLTMDGEMTVHDPGFVLVEKNRIRAVGSSREGTPQAEETVDCGGDIMMPGMVNSHCHMAMSLFRGLGEDVDDRLYRYVLPIERKFVTPQMVRSGSLLAALELIEGGVTTVADMYYFETEVGRVVDESGMRGVVGQTIADFDPPDHASIGEGFDRFAALAEMFPSHPRVTPSLAPHAPYSTGPAVLSRCVEIWERTGWPLQIHLAEMDSETEWVRKHHDKTPVELVAEAGLLREGLIAAHCLHVSPAEIEKMAAAKVKVAHNARSNAKAGRGIAPVAAMREAGISVGIATDGAMSGNTLDLFAQFAQVAEFQKLLAHSRAPMPSTDIMRMATIEAADVLGMAGEIGSLEKGKKADIVRVSLASTRMTPLYDPYAALVYAATPDDVRDVMVDGRWLMRNREVLSLDRDGVLAESAAQTARFKEEIRRIDAELRGRPAGA